MTYLERLEQLHKPEDFLAIKQIIDDNERLTEKVKSIPVHKRAVLMSAFDMIDRGISRESIYDIILGEGSS